MIQPGCLDSPVVPAPTGTRLGSLRTCRLVMALSVPAPWRSRAEGPATGGTNAPTRRVPAAGVPVRRNSSVSGKFRAVLAVCHRLTAGTLAAPE
jgi:hypothetical protein